MEEKASPEIGELVIIKIKKVFKYGAFVELEEYEKIDGYIPIGEVASRWIKNIHEFVSVGQKTVARVYRLDDKRNQIDLSLKRVSENDKKRKIEEVRRNTRSLKLFEVAGRNSKLSEDKIAEYMSDIIESYGELYEAMVAISKDKEEAIEDFEFPKTFIKELVKVATENMKPPEAVVRYECKAEVYEPKGVEIIGSLLGPKKPPKDITIKIEYAGAPNYRIKIVGPNYKVVGKYADKLFDKLKKDFSGFKSIFEYVQIKKG